MVRSLREGDLARHHGEANGPMVFPPYRRMLLCEVASLRSTSGRDPQPTPRSGERRGASAARPNGGDGRRTAERQRRVDPVSRAEAQSPWRPARFGG